MEASVNVLRGKCGGKGAAERRPGGTQIINLGDSKNCGKVLEREWAFQGTFAGGIPLKKSMIALLAGVLLLSAAMPAFAKKHHKHHHHHHNQVTETTR
jgi:hypothetical protein